SRIFGGGEFPLKDRVFPSPAIARRFGGTQTIEQNDDLAGLTKADLQNARGIFENAQNADDRSGIDRLAQSFVIKADVPAGDGRAEFVAGRSDAVNRFTELPHHVRFFRAAEIEAIRRGYGPSSAGRNVAGRFGYRVHRADAGI